MSSDRASRRKFESFNALANVELKPMARPLANSGALGGREVRAPTVRPPM
jgi:hypothetical protein